MELKKAQVNALVWLVEHGGDGAFVVGGQGGAMLAGGDTAPFMRATWNSLNKLGLVEFYGGKNGRSRCKLTLAGKLAEAGF